MNLVVDAGYANGGCLKNRKRFLHFHDKSLVVDFSKNQRFVAVVSRQYEILHWSLLHHPLEVQFVVAVKWVELGRFAIQLFDVLFLFFVPLFLQNVSIFLQSIESLWIGCDKSLKFSWTLALLVGDGSYLFSAKFQRSGIIGVEAVIVDEEVSSRQIGVHET